MEGETKATKNESNWKNSKNESEGEKKELQ